MRRLALSGWLVISAASASERVDPTDPPQFEFDIVLDAGQLDANPVRPIQLGAFTVEVGRTTLGELQLAGGVGAVHHRADDLGPAHWLCYDLPARRQRVWFEALEHGGDLLIDSVTAQQFDDPQPALAGCPTLPDAMSPLRFEGAVRLGATPQELLAAVGEPDSRVGNWNYFFYERDGEFQVDADLILHFEDGIVDLLNIGQSRSRAPWTPP